MKLKQKIMTCMAGTSLALTAFAQDPESNLNGNAWSNQRVAQVCPQLKGASKASDIIGMAVKNYQGEKLGKVEDLAVDVESGRIVEVILSAGGFLGMGTTLTAVPPAAFNCDTNNHYLQLDASLQKLKAAPKFDASDWDATTQSNQVSEVYGYYGDQPYFVAINGYWITNADGSVSNNLPRNMDGSVNTQGARSMDTVHNIEISGTNTVEAMDYSWSKLGYVQKARDFMGLPVKNLQNQDIGKVDNFIVSLPSGRIVAVVISSGGFLGMDGELSAVPPASLSYDSDRGTLRLDTSKETLANSPHFKADQWPDFGQPAYASGVYRAYNVKPYFNTNMNYAPDNTALNVRDRNTNNVTPMDQGSSQADINTTAQIRQEIVADQNLSVNAKNVKIITLNGHVTLRGPVNSADEKTHIAEIAGRVAQASNVDNQLDVIVNTTSN
jgi:sporulation protein YlmC with PRC-barrel domain